MESIEEKYCTIYKDYNDILVKFALKYCKNITEAEDIVQDCWLKIYENIELLNKVEKIKPWLMGIVKNRFIDLYNKHKKQNVLFVDDITTIEISYDNLYNNLREAELYDSFNKIIELLPTQFQDIAIKKYINGYSTKEISELLNIPLTTVKNRVNRIKYTLIDRCNILEKLDINVKQ